MKAKAPRIVLRLALARDYQLYAFPAEVTPTDERGIALTESEVQTLVQAAAASVFEELRETQARLADAEAELAQLRDQAAEHNTARALAELTKE